MAGGSGDAEFLSNQALVDAGRCNRAFEADTLHEQGYDGWRGFIAKMSCLSAFN